MPNHAEPTTNGSISASRNPTGRRARGPEHFASETAASKFPGLPEGASHAEIKDLLEALGPRSGLSQPLIRHLVLLLEWTRPQDWTAGAQPIVWLSVRETARALGISTSQVRRNEKKLHEMGALSWKDSPILLRGRHIGTFERLPDLSRPGRHRIFRITILFDPDCPREYRAIERPRAAIAELFNGIRNTAGPPPLHLQFHICEHRRGPDEFRSTLIRRDRFLDPAKADAWFELTEARLQPGEFVVLRLSGTNLRLSHAPAAAA